MAQDLALSNLLTAPTNKLDGRPAVLFDEKATTYEELNLYARCVAAWLLRQDIGKGDRTAVWLVNNIEWLGLLFGAARIGVTIVSVNTRYRANELEYLLKKSGARMLVMQPGVSLMIDMPDRLLDLLFRFLHQNDGKLSRRAREKEFAALTEDEIARIEVLYGDQWDD